MTDAPINATARRTLARGVESSMPTDRHVTPASVH
jgi:hypothetical protein